MLSKLCVDLEKTCALQSCSAQADLCASLCSITAADRLAAADTASSQSRCSSTIAEQPAVRSSAFLNHRTSSTICPTQSEEMMHFTCPTDWSLFRTGWVNIKNTHFAIKRGYLISQHTKRLIIKLKGYGLIDGFQSVCTTFSLPKAYLIFIVFKRWLIRSRRLLVSQTEASKEANKPVQFSQVDLILNI